MPTATAPHRQSISALLDAASADAATFRCKAAPPPWAVAEVPTAPPVEPAPAPESRVDKRALAAHFGMSVRWVEHRMKEGLPHEHMDGRARFRIRESEAWLRANDHLKAAE